MSQQQFDLVVIGGGPAGYVAAIRGSQLGMRVACVEKHSTLGGTCLNVGCIPSKALLESSELYAQVRSGIAVHGVSVSEVKLDLPAMMARKDKVVTDTTRGIDMLMKKNKIERLEGRGQLLSAGRVKVIRAKGEALELGCKHVLLATGSQPMELGSVPFDGKQVIDSTQALALTKVPEHLVVIGGGAIGLEMGSVWLRLGAKVSVVEMMPTLLGGLDEEISRQAERIFKRQGMSFYLGSRLEKVEHSKGGVTAVVQQADQKEVRLEGDVMLVSVGRRPCTQGLGLKEAGVKQDEQGRIVVDESYQSSVAGVYAVGDVVAGPMLAHKASEEAIAVVEGLAGKVNHLNYAAIPWIVYTWPEIAWVGQGEDELKRQGHAYKVGKYPLMANARARTMGERDGMVKVLADAATDKLLGLWILAPRASDMIVEAGLAMEFAANAEDIACSVHAHPTLSEAVKEAALGVRGQAIHI